MLVLSRKIGEKLRIGQALVTVVKWDRGGIVLGIDAPANVLVLRDELEGVRPAGALHSEIELLRGMANVMADELAKRTGTTVPDELAKARRLAQ